MYFEVSLLVLGATLSFAVWVAYLWQKRALAPRKIPPKLSDYPSITVIRPIKGLDFEAQQNIQAALDHGYPGEVETIFVFDDEDEPALALVRQAIAERDAAGESDRVKVIFSGQPPAERTGKLNAMIAGLRHAQGELIAFVDSDLRQDRDALRVLVETLLTSPGAGAAFAPVVVTEDIKTAGDAGYALMLNGMYGPAAAATANAHGGELPFIMGQFMVLKRDAIKAIGGLETAEGQLVDDMFLGMRLKDEGYRNVMSPHAVAIVQQGSSMKEFTATLVRWIAFSRSGLPALSFKIVSWMMGIAFWLGMIGFFVAALQGFALAAALTALCPLAVAGSVNHLHEAIGGAELPMRHRWVAFALWLSAPIVYFSIFTRHEVCWRGRRYHLDAHSRLA